MYTISSVPNHACCRTERHVYLGTIIESATGAVDYSSTQASTGSFMPMPAEGPGGPGSRARRTRGWGGCPVACDTSQQRARVSATGGKDLVVPGGHIDLVSYAGFS